MGRLVKITFLDQQLGSLRNEPWNSTFLQTPKGALAVGLCMRELARWSAHSFYRWRN